jgi:uncharacterized membrane protein YqjE
MAGEPESKTGMWASLKRILDLVLATAENRVELFVVELQEEKCRLIQAILCAVAVAACGLMTLTLATITIVLLFWENGRLVALGGLSFAYLVGTLLAWRGLQARLKSRSAFSATLAEITKDRSCLEDQN